MPRFFRTVLAVLLVCAATGWALPGIYMEQVIRVESSTGRPAAESVQKTWFEGRDLRTENSSDSRLVIARIGQGRLGLLDTRARTVSWVDLPLRFAPEASQMFDGARFRTRVTRTGEHRTIEGRDCERVDVDLTGALARFRLVLWVADAGRLPMREYHQTVAEVLAFNTGLKEMSEQLANLGNVLPVEIVLEGNVLGMSTRTVTRLRKVESMNVPPSLFDVPAGYRLQPLDLSSLAPRPASGPALPGR